MSTFGIDRIKTALSQAMEMLPDWQTLNPFDKGKVIDQTFKAVLKDLMQQFGMKPGVDYVLDFGQKGICFATLQREVRGGKLSLIMKN